MTFPSESLRPSDRETTLEIYCDVFLESRFLFLFWYPEGRKSMEGRGMDVVFHPHQQPSGAKAPRGRIGGVIYRG